MTGYIVDGSIAYIGDAIAPASTLEKYGIFYLYNVSDYLKSLDTLMSLGCSVYLPSHSAPLYDIEEIVNYNRQKISEIAEKITEICDTGLSFDEILAEAFNHYGITVTPEQYALIGSTLRSYLSYLMDQGRVSMVIENNMLKWKKS